MEPLDERARRRPGFDERHSSPVVLADGQAWHLAKPWYEVFATFKDGQAVDVRPTVTAGPELDALIEAVEEAPDSYVQLCCVATIGARLLLANYELSDDELDRLFNYRSHDPESWGWANDVMIVASGLGGVRNFSDGNGSH